LDFKKLGLYKIVVKKLLVNYKLRLPKRSRLHLVFYMLLLKAVLKGAALSYKEIELENELDVYNVERILNSRISKQTVKYLVK